MKAFKWGEGGGWLGGRLKLCCVSLQLLSIVVVVVCAGLLAHQTGQPQVSEAGEEHDRVLAWSVEAFKGGGLIYVVCRYSCWVLLLLLRVMDALLTKLGNLKCLRLVGNVIESLHGEWRSSREVICVVCCYSCAGLLAHQAGQPQVSEAGGQRDRVLAR